MMKTFVTKAVTILTTVALIIVVLCGGFLLIGCSDSGESGENAADGANAVSASNPPTTVQMKDPDRDGEAEEDDGMPSKKEIAAAKKKKNAAIEKANKKRAQKEAKIPNGSAENYMTRRCKHYGIKGENSPKFFKVLQDTADAYGMTIAQAQTVWERAHNG